MRLTGHVGVENEEDIPEFLRLKELSVIATPDELRKIAEFFIETANTMESMGDDYDHEHLSDRFKEFESSPHLVTFREGGKY
ncbi:hypothetical protein MJ923_20550 [Shewanella sp. 3B26]|uniref:Uncharacterized protein n=1 Tax=Shewanella zhuhaiensis TaxID=2919576 RepID=A0AAJ1BL82_9GAMM|nr:hypothetical protein [Shewanella zhuhaiensis]MCH4296698.1 hypothetical protein [Shewanella zhuhaiensis]